jgi:hypothetical protein
MVCVCELSVPVPMPVEVTLLVNVKKIAVPTYSKKLPLYNERDSIVTSQMRAYSEEAFIFKGQQ